MARFMLALVDDRGLVLDEPLVPIKVCELCGVLIVEYGDIGWQHDHVVEEY